MRGFQPDREGEQALQELETGCSEAWRGIKELGWSCAFLDREGSLQGRIPGCNCLYRLQPGYPKALDLSLQLIEGFVFLFFVMFCFLSNLRAQCGA